MDTHVFDLPDGRELGFSEAGDPDGIPVLAFHGTPGSRRQLLFPTTTEVASNVGVRLVALDRPGYGHSTFQPGRRLPQWPSDVAAVADHLGIGRFAVLGVSGGGPHALVCAALLPDRVSRAAVVSGVGPLSAVEDAEGMMRMNQVLASLARRSELSLRPLTAFMATMTRHRPEQAMRTMMKQLPPSDVAILERPEILEAFLSDGRLASATSARATAQDMTLFARPWGFDLSQISVPVDFWQGDADRNVPPAHARRQADEVKGSTLHELPGEGHFMIIDHLEEILRAAAS
ncbi:MAG TPA: alpha/beta hydrolase [Acidimicrobiales bacterium]|nr:alpha/beta hydrolase [Acidimicrobiales bacterium]